MISTNKKMEHSARGFRIIEGSVKVDNVRSFSLTLRRCCFRTQTWVFRSPCGWPSRCAKAPPHMISANLYAILDCEKQNKNKKQWTSEIACFFRCAPCAPHVSFAPFVVPFHVRPALGWKGHHVLRHDTHLRMPNLSLLVIAYSYNMKEHNKA